MKIIFFTLKELLELLFRLVSRLFVKKPDIDLTEIHRNGYLVIDNFLSNQDCSRLRSLIDAKLDDVNVKRWTDELGSDNRLYYAEELHDDFRLIFDNNMLNVVLNKLIGVKDPAKMLLAQRVDSKEGNIGSGGGWHRDSPTTHQYKFLIYLSDVEIDNGPFEYIARSQRKFEILSSVFSGSFKPGQYRYDNQEIENYLMKNKRVYDTKITGRAGTLVIVDTKGLHRGAPILANSRYTLFGYYWRDEIPHHMRPQSIYN